MRPLNVFAVLTIFVLSLVSSPHACAQTQVVLGKSAIELTGPWKFHTGDNMVWADPNFDDSAWGTMDLTLPPGSYDPLIGSSGYVPGWTAQGYRGTSGYAWYRLRINIQNAQTALALKMPDNVDDAYQIYLNGRLVGQFGRFTGHGVTAYNTQPRAFPLPANVGSGPATIAIRMWMNAFTPLVDQDAGGLHGPPVLGHASTVSELLQLDWEATNRSLDSEFLEMAVLLLALLVAFGLYWLDRKEPAYLWLGLTCAVILARAVMLVVGIYTTWISGNPLFLLQDAILSSIIIGLWVLFWAYWFRLDHMAWLHRAVWGLVVLLSASTAMLRAPLYGGVVPVHAMIWLSPFRLGIKVLLGVLLVRVAYRGIRKDRAEGWLVLPAVGLAVVSLYQEELVVLHFPANYYAFGLSISLGQIGMILLLIIITVLLLRRFLHGQREHARIRLELQQARQVQEMLIPKHATQVPGFTIESVYLPAQEVGGDFFQLLPGSDGSLLVVVGDVSGKGLRAAMTVSSIIGALRGCSSRTPAEVLAYLNRVLHGQITGFVTCCATLITADGKLTVANAGHLSPYRNGEELAVAAGLPLGILADGSYEETHSELASGDRLTYLWTESSKPAIRRVSCTASNEHNRSASTLQKPSRKRPRNSARKMTSL